MSKPAIPEELYRIGELLRTQDNRITADPMFCIQGRRRVWGVAEGFEDGSAWIDKNGGEGEEVPEPADVDDPPDGIEEMFYKDIWETIMVCFTEDGCKEHLRQNGHNYRHFEETRIYVESFYRNPEMQAIRKFLMDLNKDSAHE